MNSPVHTTSDGRQFQTNFYTPYFMDAFTGRNRDNYSPINKPISQGMAKVGNLFGRYNLALDSMKPPNESEQAWINAINNNRMYNDWRWGFNFDIIDPYLTQKPSEDFKSKMPYVENFVDPRYPVQRNNIIEAMNQNNMQQPSRAYIIQTNTDYEDMGSNEEIRIKNVKRKQKDIGL